MPASAIRTLVSERIVDIIGTFDAHNPGILDGVYLCACGFQGSETDWNIHLGSELGDALSVTTVDLPT